MVWHFTGTPALSGHGSHARGPQQDRFSSATSHLSDGLSPKLLPETGETWKKPAFLAQIKVQN